MDQSDFNRRKERERSERGTHVLAGVKVGLDRVAELAFGDLDVVLGSCAIVPTYQMLHSQTDGGRRAHCRPGS